MAIWLITSGICVYCGKPAQEAEHVVPRSIIKALYELGIMQLEYLVPSCFKCNRVAWAHYFETLQEKIKFVQDRQGIEKWRHPSLTEKIESAPLVTRSLSLEEAGKSSALRGVETRIMLGEDGRPLDSFLDDSMREWVVKKMTRPCSKCGMTFVSLSESTKAYCSDFCRRNKDYPGMYMGEV